MTGVKEGDEVVKLTGNKREIAKLMTRSLNIPQFTYNDDCDATELLKMKRLLKHDVPGLTILPFFIKAASLALIDFPLMNSVVNPELDNSGNIH